MELQQDLVGVESLVAPGRVSGSVRTCPSRPLRCWHRGVSHTAYPLTIRPVDFSVFEGVQTPPTQRSPGTLGGCSPCRPRPGQGPVSPALDVHSAWPSRLASSGRLDSTPAARAPLSVCLSSAGGRWAGVTLRPWRAVCLECWEVLVWTCVCTSPMHTPRTGVPGSWAIAVTVLRRCRVFQGLHPSAAPPAVGGL